MVAPHMADEVRSLERSVSSTLHLVDYPAEDGMTPRLEKFSTRPGSELAGELDGAAEWLGVGPEEILLAALGGALSRTRGEGALTIDVTVDGGARLQGVFLVCSDARPMGPTEMLQGAHSALAAAAGSTSAPSEILLHLTADRGATDHDTSDHDTSGRAPTDQDAGGGNHVLEARVCRSGGRLRFDWWYDATRFDPYSIEELAEQFPFALIAITSDAAAPL